MIRKQDALRYHEKGRPGKLEVIPTKPLETQRDLSLAYSPGVAEPCREIFKDQSLVSRYTARKNLVAVITNGTAVLGLGDIGPYAAKPVMEGKAVLFKKYADIDAFDLELDATDPERFIEAVATLEPTFGAINLEDIGAPDCFRIEQELEARLKIPVFHDDQHGTAIISSAALVNSAEIQGKKLSDLKVTCIGGGAAAMGCLRLWKKLGIKASQITLVDLDGVVKEDRPQLDPAQAEFARPASDKCRTMAEALVDADVMLGLSAGNIVSGEMLKTMADKPVIFALANPDPEVPYDEARAARPDAIVGTGRSDHPNQVNNVLGFPYIFRGALDVGATAINDEMKLAAATALAELAREGVPDQVLTAYGSEAIRFGPDYVIPKAMDERALARVASAVAGAAIETGVATDEIDVAAYRSELERRLNPTRRVMWHITERAKREPKRIVLPDGEHPSILRAADIAAAEGIAHPVLIARPEIVKEKATGLGIDLGKMEIIDPRALPEIEAYAQAYWELRRKKGVTLERARSRITSSRNYYGMMMVREGAADGLVGGIRDPYPATIRPALEIIGIRDDVHRAAGTYMVITKNDVKFFADTTINIDPDAATLAETALLVSELTRELGIEPRVAMLSFSNFGDAPHPSSAKVAEAVRIARERDPTLIVEGEMQADVALLDKAREPYPFSALQEPANVLVFPNLDAGNIAYKLIGAMSEAEVVGPLVLGMRQPVNVLQQGADSGTVLHMIALTVSNAACRESS